MFQDSVSMHCPGRAAVWRQRTGRWLPGAKRGEGMSRDAHGDGVSAWGVEKFLKLGCGDLSQPYEIVLNLCIIPF